MTMDGAFLFHIGYAGGSPDGVRAEVHAFLLLNEVAVGGYYVLAKIALSTGLHQLAFAVYRNAFGLCILIPFAYFYEHKTRKPLTIPALKKFVLLGFIGVYLNQFLFYSGLVLTNATFASAMQNLVPVFTLIIAANYKDPTTTLRPSDFQNHNMIFIHWPFTKFFGCPGVELVGFKHRCGQAKIIGLSACVSGAILMTFYKGPPLLRLKSGAPTLLLAEHPRDFLDRLLVVRMLATLGFVFDPWKLGALCLVGNTLCLGTFINIQSVALARHPAPISLAASVFSMGEAMLVTTGVALIKDPKDWIVPGLTEVAAILYAGAVVSCLSVGVIAWSISKTGPVLAASYSPFQAVPTAIFAFIFLKEAFYLGSFIGTILIIVGLFLTSWGQRASGKMLPTLDNQSMTNSSSNGLKEPLLG